MKSLRLIGILPFLFVLILTTQGQTGETFISLEGKAAVYSTNEKKITKKEIPAVHSKIDFETKELIFHFELPISPDSLSYDPLHFTFKGSLDLDRFLSEGNHSRQEFLIHGTLDINGESSPVILKANKDHLGISDDINCRLLASLEIDQDQFNLSGSSLSSDSGYWLDLILLIPEYNSKLSR